MLFKNVLVPYDESEHASAALHLAIDMVGDDPEAMIRVVTVVSNDIMPPSALSAAVAFDASPVSYENYEALLSHIAERSDRELRESISGLLGKDMQDVRAKVIVETRLASSPVEGITNYAADHRCDLIVMGRRGLGALRGMLGSVSYGVLRSADIPVLTVK